MARSPDPGGLDEARNFKDGSDEGLGLSTPGRNRTDPIPRPTVPDRPASSIRIGDILAAWRAAERGLAEATDEALRARFQWLVSDLRSLHGRVFDERSRSLDRDATDPAASGRRQSLPADSRR